MSQTPSIGRIVHYKLTWTDMNTINDAVNGGAGKLAANVPRVGDVYPAMIVRTWGGTAASSVQLQVFIDGNFTIWATSVCAAEHSPDHGPDNPHPERSYIWPPRT